MRKELCLGTSCFSALVGLFSCSGPDLSGDSTDGSGGTAMGDGGAFGNSGGSASPPGSGGASSSSGGASAGGGTQGGGGTGTGGEVLSSGGVSSGGGVGAGGGAGTGGDAAARGCEELPPLPMAPALDCGESGVVLLDSGRPANRVNYVIVGDGYTAEQLDTLYLEHVRNMLEHEWGMFGEMGEPYRRYKRYINVCALRVASKDGCVDDRDTGQMCDTAFNGYGDDASRLGIVDELLVYSKVGDLLPESVEPDWLGVTIHAGADNWWNSGGAIMVWNGGFEPQGQAASVALHEGGHAFHGLADEYAGDSQTCDAAPEKNVSTSDGGEKWMEWLGFEHSPGTGPHGSYEGARYCSQGVYRPTQNSEMNQLPDFFNMPSIQKMVHDIYEVVAPIDAHTDNTGILSNPAALQVRLVDPEVVRLRWSVDGVEQPETDEDCFSLVHLPAGDHLISVQAKDETPWVRDDRSDLSQSVAWSVTIDP